jgi:hypothetical protein
MEMVGLLLVPLSMTHLVAQIHLVVQAQRFTEDGVSVVLTTLETSTSGISAGIGVVWIS